MGCGALLCDSGHYASHIIDWSMIGELAKRDIPGFPSVFDEIGGARGRAILLDEGIIDWRCEPAFPREIRHRPCVRVTTERGRKFRHNVAAIDESRDLDARQRANERYIAHAR